jgi:hypothetical protein
MGASFFTPVYRTYDECKGRGVIYVPVLVDLDGEMRDGFTVYACEVCNGSGKK